MDQVDIEPLRAATSACRAAVVPPPMTIDERRASTSAASSSFKSRTQPSGSNGSRQPSKIQPGAAARSSGPPWSSLLPHKPILEQPVVGVAQDLVLVTEMHGVADGRAAVLINRNRQALVSENGRDVQPQPSSYLHVGAAKPGPQHPQLNHVPLPARASGRSRTTRAVAAGLAESTIAAVHSVASIERPVGKLLCGNCYLAQVDIVDKGRAADAGRSGSRWNPSRCRVVSASASASNSIVQSACQRGSRRAARTARTRSASSGDKSPRLRAISKEIAISIPTASPCRSGGRAHLEHQLKELAEVRKA